MLRLHLETWAGYPYEVRSRFVFIIVDDASPTWPAAEVLKADPIDAEIELYRIKHNVAWAWDAARNIAMANVPEGWTLLTDMDHLLPLESAEAFLAADLNPNKGYVPSRIRAVDGKPYKPHPNSYVLTRALFWKAGGYDEQFVGYYGKDRAFRRQLDAVAAREDLPAVCLTLYGREVIPDASTTAYSRKDGPYYTCNHPAVRRAINRTHIDGVKKSMTMDYERVL